MGTHDAAASAIGYRFQVQWAFLELLRGSREQPDRVLALELLDDVDWADDAGPGELLQVKHHLKEASLTDRSVDLWRTLQVWMDFPPAHRDDGPLLGIVTTAVAPDGTAAALLQNDDARDPLSAKKLLDAAAEKAESETTKAARRRWLSLPDSVRESMVDRIRVFASVGGIETLEEQIRAELRFALPPNGAEEFLGLVHRWWERVSLQLLLRQLSGISAADARDEVQRIRNQFADDTLPTLVQLSDIDELALFDAHKSRPFVQQLQWVKVSTVNLRKAVADYHRAVTQTTRWMDTNLLNPNEYQDFEDRLVDEWERAFANMIEDLGEDPDEAACVEMGRKLFRALQDSSTVTIRKMYSEPFYAAGARHSLADDMKLGWHRDWVARVEQLTVGAAH
jgi:hypothetical protein